MQRKVNLSTLIVTLVCGVLITFLLTFAITFTIYQVSLKSLEKNGGGEMSEEMEVFSSIAELYEQLPDGQKNLEMYTKLASIDLYYRMHYAREINEEEMIYYMINGYIAGLGDMHGEYYTRDDFESLITQTEGNSVGIGVYVNQDVETGNIKILTVMNNSPALEAGLKKGDLISAVDGKKVSEIGYYDALQSVAGKENTKVTLTVVRNGTEFTVSVTRKLVETETVYYHKYALDPKVGVVRVLEFNNTTPAQFKTAVSTLLNEQGCEALIFDMRGNPGGTLDSALEILDYLISDGLLVQVTDGQGNVVEEHYTKDKGEIDVPMAVLTDGNTASAGELFTCALRDYNKAVIIGTKTYGKGSMQSVIRLDDGTGLRFTTYLYNPPKTPNYDGIGITPDVVVELDKELENKNYFEITDQEDNQLKSAYEALLNKDK